MTNIDTEFSDFIELMDYTFHRKFIEKWRYKYSEKFLKHFQIKLLDSFRKDKILKKSSLRNYLIKKCKYAPEQVDNFFESIDLSIYSPFIVIDK